MSNNSRKFHLGNLLSITTGILFPAPEDDYPIEGVYKILDFMTGDSLQTIALGRGADECKPYLLEQHPFLREIIINRTEIGSNWEGFLADMVQKYGAYHSVRPIHPEDHEVLHPLEDLKRLGFTGEVIEFKIDDEVNPTGDINWKV